MPRAASISRIIARCDLKRTQESTRAEKSLSVALAAPTAERCGPAMPLAVSPRLFPQYEHSSLRRAIVNTKLVLRVGKSMDSQKVGNLLAGSEVIVLEEFTLEDGVVRARIGYDSTPRGLCVVPRGWVTTEKEGETKLTYARVLREVIEGASKRIITQSGAAVDAGSHKAPSGKTSMASRIAKRRQDHRERRTAARAATPAAAAEGVGLLPTPAQVSKDAPASSSAKIVQKKAASTRERPFTWQSADHLRAKADQMLADADIEETKQFSSLEATLGSLLKEKGIKLEKLMLEWDRNNDNQISKLEFRVNVRKIGLSETTATTQQIDSLFDSLDLDNVRETAWPCPPPPPSPIARDALALQMVLINSMALDSCSPQSGQLEIREVKAGLKKMANDVEVQHEKAGRVQERATNLRRIAGLFSQAADDTTKVDDAERILSDHLAGTPSQRLGALLKARQVKVSNVVAEWDKDGSGTIDRSEFVDQVKALGLKESNEDIAGIFMQMDEDSSGELSVDEIMNAMKKLASDSITAKSAENKQVKVVARARKQAEASQQAAQSALHKDEAEQRVLAVEQQAAEAILREKAMQEAARREAAVLEEARAKAKVAGKGSSSVVDDRFEKRKGPNVLQMMNQYGGR